MHLKFVPLISITLICSLTTEAQSTAIDINAANPQRTRVLDTKGLETAPTQILWKTEKLFQYRASEWISADNGPFKINVNVPTDQNFSVPIIAGDLLYFTYVASDGFVFAIEKTTGQKVLLLQFDNNSVSPPAALDNIVFFGSGRGQVHAYDVRKREEKWTFVDKHHSFAGSRPILDRDLLYFYAADRGLYAFVAGTGAVKWLFKSEKFVHTPAVAGDRVILLTATGHLIAVDRATGTTRWDVGVGRDAIAPAVLGNQIFLVYGGGEIRSYSALDGTLQWKSKDVPRSGTPVVLHKGMVYYAGRENSVIATDATTGAEKLRFKTNRRCYAPVIAGELLYVRCEDRKLYALSTATLAEVWQIQNEKVIPPPVVFADGVMYSLGTDGYMYAMK